MIPSFSYTYLRYNHLLDKSDAAIASAILLFLLGLFLWAYFNEQREKYRKRRLADAEIKKKQKEEDARIRSLMYEREIERERFKKASELKVIEEKTKSNNDSLENGINTLRQREFQSFINIQDGFWGGFNKYSRVEDLVRNNDPLSYFDDNKNLFYRYNHLPQKYETELISLVSAYNLKKSEINKNAVNSFSGHGYKLDVEFIKRYFGLRKQKLEEINILATQYIRELKYYAKALRIPSELFFEITEKSQIPFFFPASRYCKNRFTFSSIDEEENNINEEEFRLIKKSYRNSFAINEMDFTKLIVIKPHISKSEFITQAKDSIFINDIIKLNLTYSFADYIYYWKERNVDVVKGGFKLESINSYYLSSLFDDEKPRMLPACFSYYNEYLQKLKRQDLNINDYNRLIESELTNLYNSEIKSAFKDCTIETTPKYFIQTTVFMVYPNLFNYKKLISYDDVLKLNRKN